MGDVGRLREMVVLWKGEVEVDGTVILFRVD